MSDASREGLPLKGYAVLSGVHTVATTSLLFWGRRTGKMPSSVPLADVALLGIATHQASRLLSRSKVLTYVREPFTVYQTSDGALPGEVRETRRSGGEIRQAIGELVTCPYCMAPWVAAGLFGLYVADRPIGRVLSGLLSAVTIADFMHTAYTKLNRH